MTEESLSLLLAAEIPGSGEVPTEFQIFPFGRVDIKGDEPFTVDAAAVDEVVRKFEARGLDMVIDYEHHSEGGGFSSPDGTAPAAGWIKKLANRGEQGLWAVVEWTERARGYLARKEYRYYSPVFLVSKGERRLVELLRVALTNVPRLSRIKPIVAKGQDPEKESAQTSTEESLMKEFLILCAKALSLVEDATQVEVLAAIKSLKDGGKPKIAGEVLAALDLTDSATESEVVASIHALKQKPDLTAEVSALKNRLAERDRNDLVSEAMKSGKITPAQKEWADAYALRDPEGFRLFIAKAPRVVPVGDINLAPDDPSGKQPDAVQLQINKMMGVGGETWKQFGS